MKKILSAIVSIMALIMPLANVQASTFNDISTSDANFSAITMLSEKGIIAGYADNTFKPDQVVNRVEALKMILLSINASLNSSLSLSGKFSDINVSAWYAVYLKVALDKGIIKGYPDGTFKPGQTVNMVEAVSMILKAHGIDTSTVAVDTNPYVDAYKTEWYAKSLQYAKNVNLLTPTGNSIFPSEGLTRAEFAEILARLLTVIENNKTKFDGYGDNAKPIVVTVDIKNFAFSPATLEIAKGTTVTWTNSDSMSHTVTATSVSDASLTMFDSGTILKGKTFVMKFDQVGEYNYNCTPHPSMTGKIVVK